MNTDPASDSIVVVQTAQRIAADERRCSLPGGGRGRPSFFLMCSLARASRRIGPQS